MRITVNLPISYRSDPIDPNVKTINFKLQQDFTQKEYDQNKAITMLMDQIAEFINQKLPANAMIVTVGQKDMLMKKADIVMLYHRHDDFLAVNSFTNQTVIQTDKEVNTMNNNSQSDNSVSNSPDMHADLANNKPKSVKPHLIDVQKPGKRSYVPFNLLTDGEPKDDDYLNHIGMSIIDRVHWGDIKDIVKQNEAFVFTHPLGILPENSSVTDRRRDKFARNSGLDSTQMKDLQVKNLGSFNSNGKYLKLVGFYQPDEEKKTTASPAIKENISSVANTQKQPADTAVQTGTGTVNQVNDTVNQNNNLKRKEDKQMNNLTNDQAQSSFNTAFGEFKPENNSSTSPVNNNSFNPASANAQTKQNQTSFGNSFGAFKPENAATDSANNGFNPASANAQAKKAENNFNNSFGAFKPENNNANSFNSASTPIKDINDYQDAPKESPLNSGNSQDDPFAENDTQHDLMPKLDQILSVNKQSQQDSAKSMQNILKHLDKISADLKAYQDTANEAFTLATLQNEKDVDKLSPAFVKWANMQKTPDEKANAIMRLFAVMSNPTQMNSFANQFGFKLNNSSETFLQAVNYLSSEI